MTLLAEPLTPTGHRQSLRMTHITRRAETQVKKLLLGLSPDDREKLVSDLLRPIPYHLCDIITHREKHRLFHYRARCGAAIRICFRRLSGPDAVILDVARHDEFEEFANNFTGSYGTYIPIEESQVMTKGVIRYRFIFSGVIRCQFVFSRVVIRYRFIFSGKNDELTPDFACGHRISRLFN